MAFTTSMSSTTTFLAALGLSVACSRAPVAHGSGGSGGGGGSGPMPGDGAGIQGCAARFVEQDGRCHPALDKCPGGSIPKFDEGCVPVGIAGCSGAFVEADGSCHVSMSKCPSGTFAVPTEGCVPIDGAAGCGQAPWGAIADMPGTLWVDPGYAGGDGDGSKAKPVTTIGAALALAPEAGRVALAAGSYAEAVLPTRSVEIVGRCPSMVKVTGTAAFDGVTAIVGVHATPAGVTLRSLQIGGAGIGVFVNGVAKATLDHVWVNQATGSALAANYGALVAVEHSVFQGTLVDATSTNGEAISSGNGASVTVEASAVVGNVGQGITSFPGSVVTFTNGLVEGTSQPAGDQAFLGIGVNANGGKAVVTGSAVVANQTYGLDAYYGGELDLGGSVVEATKAGLPPTPIGVGVRVASGSTASITGTAVLGNVSAGIDALDAKTQITITEALVADTKGDRGGVDGSGVSVQAGSAVHLVGTTLARNQSGAVAVLGAGATVDATASLFEGATTYASLVIAPGVLVESGASATLEGCAVVGNTGAGVWVEPGCSGALTHTLVADTLLDAVGNNGVGVFSNRAKSLQVSASVVIANQGAGVLAVGPLAMDGSWVSGVKPGRIALVTPPAVSGPATDGIGDGVLVVGGSGAPAGATIASSTVEGCDRAGILFVSSAGSIDGSWATKNRFGLVTQGSPVPSAGAGDVFVQNTGADRLENGSLPVPAL
jgi:hypothetical protein